MAAVEKQAFSADDFLAWESSQEMKNEFIAGEIFAMAGASDAHVTISGNLFAALRSHLRGKPCRAYIADMKLSVQTAKAFFYPDVFVTCSPADAARPDFKADPVLIVEVLSPSTAAYDRGLKFAYYRELPGLQEYVVIDPEHVGVEIYRRDASGHWVLYPYGRDEVAEFACVGLNLSVAEIYEDVSPVRAAQ